MIRYKEDMEYWARNKKYLKKRKWIRDKKYGVMVIKVRYWIINIEYRIRDEAKQIREKR